MARAARIPAGRLTKGNDAMRLTTGSRVTLTAAFMLLLVLNATSAGSIVTAATDEHFSVREYNLFHDVLHPLQHEALPKKDFKTIRAQADKLVTRGRAILQLGVPTGVEAKDEFTQGLKEFERALAAFDDDARKGTDARLEQSYTALHDAFEMLASLLPRR